MISSASLVCSRKIPYLYSSPLHKTRNSERYLLTNLLAASTMSSAELSARLRYLNDAAHLQATAAPSTSRHLRSRCNALMAENELSLAETHRREACGACGTLTILGLRATMRSETQPARRRRARPGSPATQQTKSLLYECNTCSRKTRFPLSNPLPATRHKTTSVNSRSILTSQPLTKLVSGSSVSETRSSSKKRTKARKRGGLKALLAAKNSVHRVSGFGLDLMDFMKKP
jgi:RNase P subunit RPR2